MQCSAWRPTSSASTSRAAVVEQHEVELLRPVAVRARRSTATCTGSSAPRSRSAAAAGGRPRGRATRAAPSRSPSRSRAPRAASCTCGRCPRTRRPRPSRSRRPRSSRRETATGTDEELLAQVRAARPRRSPSPPSRGPRPGRSCARTAAGSRRGSCGSPARGCATTARRASWMISSARSVSIASMPSRRERVVEPDLVGGDRLDLDHLARAVVVGDAGHDRVRLGGVARPVHDAARRACTDASRRSSCSGSVAIARALIAAPASRSASQSASSAIAASRLARIVVVALPRLRRSWRVAAAPLVRRRRGKPDLHSCAARISARCIVAHAGALPPQRAADVHQARVVGRRADLRARVEQVAQLVGEHRHRGVGVLDRERAAEAAALLRVLELDEVDALRPRAAAAAAGRRRAAAAASGRSGGTRRGAGTRRRRPPRQVRRPGTRSARTRARRPCLAQEARCRTRSARRPCRSPSNTRAKRSARASPCAA